jgi:ABC-2 type transport system permease protein
MRRLIDIFFMSFKLSLAVQVQYQAAMFIWFIGAVLEPLIYLVVWTTVARLQGGSVGGVTPPGFAAYYIALMVVNQWTFTWIMWEYEYTIRDGTLARRLMRPVHPIVNDLADNVAYKLVTSSALVPAAVLMIVFFHPQFTISPRSLLAFLPSFMFAFALRFSLEWSLAMAAFWTTRITAINQIYFTMLLFLSGRLAPLELMPGFVRTLATLLPFRWLLSFPLDVLLGKATGADLLWGYAAQIGWIAASVTGAALAWRAGVKQFSAVGS